MTAIMPDLAPAREIDWDVVVRTLEESIVDALRNDEAFTQSTDLRSQCFHACRILRVNRLPCVPYSLIGRILGVNKGTIQRHFKQCARHADAPPANGRPPLLNPAEQAAVCDFVADAYRRRSPCVLAELKAHIVSTFHVVLEKSTLCHIIGRDPRLKTCRGIPIEAKRAEVTPEQIRNFFAEALTIAEGVPSHFVFNMDEMGHQEWADRKEIICVVPIDHEGDHVCLPVPRTGKRITLLSCIALDGSFLKPTVIVPRKTVDDDLPLTGMTPEKVTVQSQIHGFVNTSIFDSWFQETFVPELTRRRGLFGYDGPAVLLMDNCSCHMSDRISELCEREHVRRLYFPPHRSNQLQPLDLSLFGVTKRLLAQMNRLEAVNIQTRHIAQVVSAFMSAATPTNIVKTFSLSGMALIVDSEGILRCQVRPDRARRVVTGFMPPIPGCEPATDATSDDEEIQAFKEDFAELLYDLEDSS